MDRKIVIVTALLIAFPAGIGTVLAQTNADDTDAGAQATGPDLIAEDLAHEPEAPTPGQNVTFTANVTNQGENATGAFNVTFLIDGAQLGPNQTIENLEAGNSTELTTDPWNATEGEHTFTVIVDAHDDVNETDEANNEATHDLEVEDEEDPEPADLVADELAAGPADPSPGDNVTFSATVSNDGESDASNVTVRFLVDGGQHGENITLETLAAGNATTVTSETWNATEGDHTIEVLVDPDDDINETDEDNNEATLALTVEEDEHVEDPDEGDESEDKITICHVPPGNPDARHTIEIGEPAWGAHEGHGDHKGACEEGGNETAPDDDNENGNETASQDDEDSGNQTASEDEEDEEDAQAEGEDHEQRRGPPEHARDRRDR